MNSGNRFFCLLSSGLCLLLLTGCASAWKSPRIVEMRGELSRLEAELAQARQANAELERRLRQLEERLRQAEAEKDRRIRALLEEKEQAVREAEKAREADDLLEAQRRLTRSLKEELGEARAKLEMTERGLVLTLLDEIFFDSGKAVVKESGDETLAKVARVLRESVPDSPVAVEGHTDNEPIRYSGWKSNWELSSARALAVVHRFIDEHGVEPGRLRAAAFGEYQPVADNGTPEGRRQNRRVEVVILPQALKKVKP